MFESILPFWVCVLLVCRLFFGTYTSVLLASILFGAAELFRGRKSDDAVWKKLYSDLSIVGHKGCALNAPENTLASKLFHG